MSNAALLEVADGRLDRAATLLALASKLPNADATVFNDLAAVRLALGDAHGDPFEIVLSLAAAEQALQRDNSLNEAAFNRALALDRLTLRSEARRAWENYLESETSPRWVTEARSHFTTLTAPHSSQTWENEQPRLIAAILRGDDGTAEELVRQFPQAARIYVEEDIFAEWARARQIGDTAGATRALQLATGIGNILLKITGDALVSASAASIVHAKGLQADELAAGHLLYSNGIVLYRNLDLDRARPILMRASTKLRQGGTPFYAWANLYTVACDYQRKHYDAVLQATSELEDFSSANSYFNLRGRSSWLGGLVYLERAEPTRALIRFDQALKEFKRTGELGYQASVYALLANAQSYLGESREAWRHRYQGLKVAVRSGETEQIPVIFGEAARALARDGQPEIGLAFQNEALTLERQSQDPLSITEALWWRSMIFHRAGKDRQALRDLAEARLHCVQIVSPDIRTRTLAGIAVTEGAALRHTNPAGAIHTLTQALSYYKNTTYRYLFIEILRERARAFLALGQIERATADLAGGIAEYERQRSRIEEAPLQLSFFEQAHEIFDEMIALQAARGKPEQAFAYAERGRARLLLDALTRSQTAGCRSFDDSSCPQGKPLAPAEIRQQLPRQAILVEYTVLPNQTFAWRVGPDGIRQFEIRAKRAALATLVSELLEWAQGGEGPPPAATQQLFDLLIEPLLVDLPQGSLLILVPDKELQSLPFACLINRKTGRYLIEEMTLALAPSASTYIRALASARDFPVGQLKVLAIGNPTLDRSITPLPLLRWAGVEARRIASIFPDSLLLLGPQATAQRFLVEASRHEIIHFAGHAIVNTTSPLDSKLIFSPSATKPGSGEIYARDIYKLRLERVRLVVLSACGTGVGAHPTLEGSIDLARPFLASGAPAVLATLWSIEDEAANKLVTQFYHAYMKNQDPISALRTAQLGFLRSTDPNLRRPVAWAGFQLIGASKQS